MNTSDHWKTLSDTEKFSLAKQTLFTAVVGDVLDAAGYLHQFLPPHIRPLDPKMVTIGRAMTVLEADCFEQQVRAEGKAKPFGLMFDALDDLKPNEIYVCTGSSHNYALWGELMSTRALRLGAVGAIVDGFSRDTNGILNLGFPTFSSGTYAQDQGMRGRVIDYRCTLRFSNNVQVEPGDILFGDRDGVVVIPKKIENDILAAAYEKATGENKVRDAIEAGMSTREAWDTFGIM
ncbi:RraA family protein [Cerasicoccus frondis]|uniref:RraA family protein n=1 Tax=Cerasicoccus frondis TaxID=490090 RepID=UPI002852DB3E|nr:RraA family protein [Cerasicoccus frondis]